MSRPAQPSSFSAACCACAATCPAAATAAAAARCCLFLSFFLAFLFLFLLLLVSSASFRACCSSTSHRACSSDRLCTLTLARTQSPAEDRTHLALGPVGRGILARRWIRASYIQGRLLRRGHVRYPCERSRSRQGAPAGADKVHACRLQTDRRHAALAPPARRHHSPCLPGVVSIPGADQPSTRGRRAGVLLTGCLDFGDCYY